MDAQRPPTKNLDSQAFKLVCEYAVANLVLPDDVVRLFAGLQSREPFLLPRDKISGPKEIDRFLQTLTLLYKHGRRRFEEAAPAVRGTRRTYFGKTATDVWATGNTNRPEQIPDSPWYVSVNSDGFRKAKIVYSLMCKMGFSADYAEMVSSLSNYREAQLPADYARALYRLS